MLLQTYKRLMPKISAKNKRYRTKEQICKDLAFVLNSDLNYGTKFAVLSEITWVWTEFHGKYDGCKYWSDEALKIKNRQSMLIHEHVVPKKVLIDYLMGKQNLSPKEIYEFLEKFCIGVVVTKAEDQTINNIGLRSKMPSDWDFEDPWARYEGLNINITFFD